MLCKLYASRLPWLAATAIVIAARCAQARRPRQPAPRRPGRGRVWPPRVRRVDRARGQVLLCAGGLRTRGRDELHSCAPLPCRVRLYAAWGSTLCWPQGGGGCIPSLVQQESLLSLHARVPALKDCAAGVPGLLSAPIGLCLCTGLRRSHEWLQEIKSLMPPVHKIEESLAERSTDSFPPPLNMAPLPPMIVTEKGEARVHRRLQLLCCMACLRRLGCIRSATTTVRSACAPVITCRCRPGLKQTRRKSCPVLSAGCGLLTVLRNVQALDEFCARQYPDFFTAIQVPRRAALANLSNLRRPRSVQHGL
jgi:hypothetical protein